MDGSSISIQEGATEMTASKPALLVLPFQARVPGTFEFLSIDVVLRMVNNRQRPMIHIERSYPGARHAIGWTIFRRTVRSYLYENEPLFRFERGARRYIRKAYAIHYSLLGDDGMTYSHLHL